MSKIEDQIGGIFSRLGTLQIDTTEIKGEMMRRSDVEEMIVKQSEICGYRYKEKKSSPSIVPPPDTRERRLSPLQERIIWLVIVAVLGALGIGPHIDSDTKPKTIKKVDLDD